jgi:hypothetical protein
MSEDAAVNDPLDQQLRSVVEALTTTVQALARATEVLQCTADQLVRAVQAGGQPSGEAPSTVSAWEDDPFSEGTPSVPPVLADPVSQQVSSAVPGTLAWRISDQRPSPAAHPTGSTEFRYWNAHFTLAHARDFWAGLCPQGTRWSAFHADLPVALDVGEDLNAFYSRSFGLRFYHRSVQAVPIYSGASPDVIRHELGHAVLDALRPELFDASTYEVDAFHEAFGDMSAMLAALQLPTFRERLLQEMSGRLTHSSRLSRFAEQLGWGIRQQAPDAVDLDCLRNAANRFSYQAPMSLPDRAPATELSRAPHSLSRVFTGAFLDALADMVDAVGGPSDANLDTVSRDLGQLLVDGILAASVTPTFYSQVAAAMVQAAKVRTEGRYRSALLGAFVGRGVIDLAGARDLESATLPAYQRVGAGPATDRGMASAPGASGDDDLLLGYEAASEGYRATATEAPSLPLVPVHAEFLDQPVSCHAAAEEERFPVSPSVYGFAQSETDPTESAKQYLATLIRLGRLDPGPVPGMARGAAAHHPEHRTHRLEQHDDGLVLKRIHFA